MKFKRKKDGQIFNSIEDALNAFRCPGPCNVDCYLNPVIQLPTGENVHKCDIRYAETHQEDVAKAMGFEIIEGVGKTDFQAVKELQELYTPQEQGKLSPGEVDLILGVLEITDRNEIELRNIRNAICMLYGQAAAAKQDPKESIAIMDAMSGAVHVVDMQLASLGFEV